MRDKGEVEAIEDQLGILQIRIEKLQKNSDKLEIVKSTDQRKAILEQISKEIERSNLDVKNIQNDIKYKAPPD